MLGGSLVHTLGKMAHAENKKLRVILCLSGTFLFVNIFCSSSIYIKYCIQHCTDDNTVTELFIHYIQMWQQEVVARCKINMIAQEK